MRSLESIAKYAPEVTQGAGIGIIAGTIKYTSPFLTHYFSSEFCSMDEPSLVAKYVVFAIIGATVYRIGSAWNNSRRRNMNF